MMHTRDFDYELPEELIAAHPAQRRDEARLLHLRCDSGAITHGGIGDLPRLLRRGDVLVVNDTRVIPARLLGRRVPGGGRTELLLIRSVDTAEPCPPAPEGKASCRWEALVRPGKKIRPGDRIVFGDGQLEGKVAHFAPGAGSRIIEFQWPANQRWDEILDALGKTPLPPYILRRRQEGHRTYPWDDNLSIPEDRERYQTVYARVPGSVAAPTAGLHFTAELLERLTEQGIERVAVTLHVGPGTFLPVEVEEPEHHPMHEEEYEVSESAARTIETAWQSGRRIVAVGTTVVRVLEHVAGLHGEIVAGNGSTQLLILPGYEFQRVGALLTNFHLPRSTLLMLVAAFAGPEHILNAYREAVRERYRFYSYGDAMFLDRGPG
jgi:S-adenosylmethionine:tRNA ribosyltransferase-isomerase